MKTMLTLFAFSLFTAACASAPDAREDATSSDEDELRKSSIFACHMDADCVAVEKAECCPSGRLVAVNKNHTDDYAKAYACTDKPTACPLYVIKDTRVAECSNASHKCEMVAIEDIQCGGFIGNAHACPTGYACTHAGASMNPDLPGACAAAE
jgi:hypothetical protein